MLGRHLQGEIDRETVRVVQLERAVAAEHRLMLPLGVGDREIKDLSTRGEGAPERILFGVRRSGRCVPSRSDLVGLSHQVPADRQQLGQHGLGHPQTHGAYHPTKQPAEHITPGLIAWGDPIGDQHQTRPDVVADHPQPYVVLMPAAVALVRELSGVVDYRVDLIDLVEVVHPLQQVRDALQTHPGVDVLAWQVASDVEIVLPPDRRQLFLHEDQIPDLQEAILVHDRPAVRAVFGAAVDIDLAARPTRSRHSHVPVVVEHATPLNPLRWQVCDVSQRRGLVVQCARRSPRSCPGRTRIHRRLVNR